MSKRNHKTIVPLSDEQFADFLEEFLARQYGERWQKKKILYHVGISGGKDSTALLLWIVRESGIPHDQIIVSFCDTQNEADVTYEHVRLLDREVFPIRWLMSEGFLNLALRKGRFPSTKARFCTTELKLKVSKRFLDALQFQYSNFEVVAVSGVRRGESEERSKLSEWGNSLESYFGLREWRPLIDWQIEDVLTIHAKYKVSLNPLYSQGARRVGCFPCVMSSKEELRAAVNHYPATIEKLSRWEGLVGSTMFPPNMVPPRFMSKTVQNKKGKTVKICTIADVARWANSGWRAKGQAPDVDGLYEDELKEMEPKLCLAQHLACE